MLLFIDNCLNNFTSLIASILLANSTKIPGGPGVCIALMEDLDSVQGRIRAGDDNIEGIEWIIDSFVAGLSGEVSR